MKFYKHVMLILMTFILITIQNEKILAQHPNQTQTNDSYLKKIHFNEVIPFKSNEKIKVAVIDSGIDFLHPKFSKNIIEGKNFIEENKQPNDNYGHGTNIAGVINKIGNAFGDNVQLLPIKVLGANGKGDTQSLIDGIYYAIEKGVKVICLSLGISSNIEDLKIAIDSARRSDITIVASSGNTAGKILYPAAYDGVISVGGITTQNTRHTKSNYGEGLEISAPYIAYTTFKGGYESYFEGTSIAAAEVAGAAALFRVKYPSLTSEQVIDAIRNSAEDIGNSGYDDQTGFGLLRIDQLVNNDKYSDLYEPNNILVDAKNIPVNKWIAAKLEDSIDLYKFSISSDGIIKLALESSSNIDYQILDISGQILKKSNSLIEFESHLKPGVYYIEILSSKSLNYRLNIRFNKLPDKFEPNNIRSNAYLIRQNKETLSANLIDRDDIDYYQIDVKNPSTITLKFEPAYQSDTNNFIATFESEASNVKLLMNSLKSFSVSPGSYFIRVQKNGQSEVSDYSLSYWLDNFSLEMPYQLEKETLFVINGEINKLEQDIISYENKLFLPLRSFIEKSGGGNKLE